MFHKKFIPASVACLLSVSTQADVGKIYHPYVEPLEREIEFMTTQSFDDLDQRESAYTLGYGEAIHEKFFLELSAKAIKNDDEGLEVEDWELEGLLQLSEQGANIFDYGILFELERETEENITEAGLALLLEKELGSTSLAANIGVAYEFGSGIDNEYDRFLRTQWRYRLQPSFEPALELHLDEYDKAAGPALLGLVRLGNRQKFKWEFALLFALEDETPDTLLKAVLEFEF